MTAEDAARPTIALLAFDFAEVSVALANALAVSADVALLLPERVVVPVRADVVPEVRVEPFAMPRLRQPVRQAHMCRDLLRRLDRVGADLVHLQQGHLWFNLALPLLGDRPLVVTIHDVEPHPGDRLSRKTPQPVMDLAWRRADRLIAHTEVARQAIVRRHGRDPSEVDVVPHVAIGRMPDPEGPPPEPGTVLFFGRIWPYKGLEHLVRAEPMISAQVPHARIVIAGQGEDLGRYRALMSDPARFVVVNQYVPIEQRSKLFAQAEVVVLPYVEASQSGVVPLAYAFSRPVVATAVGGLPEAVEHDRTGIVVPPRDHRALARAVVRLLEDPELAREMGAAGRRKLEREWSPLRVAERTMRTYERVLAGHRRQDLRRAG
jgi:glycosyltransferase involved in cell wall biosynthesis